MHFHVSNSVQFLLVSVSGPSSGKGSTHHSQTTECAIASWTQSSKLTENLENIKQNKKQSEFQLYYFFLLLHWSGGDATGLLGLCISYLGSDIRIPVVCSNVSKHSSSCTLWQVCLFLLHQSSWPIRCVCQTFCMVFRIQHLNCGNDVLECIVNVYLHNKSMTKCFSAIFILTSLRHWRAENKSFWRMKS